MKLYYVDNGPPSMGVRLALKVSGIACELISIDYMKGEHTTAEYAEVHRRLTILTVLLFECLIV